MAESQNKSDEQFRTVDGAISRNTFFLIVGSALILGVSPLLYFLLRRKLHADRLGLIDAIQRNRKELEQEWLKMDTKLV